MHPKLLKEVVRVCRARQGTDCPLDPPISRETLEFAVVDLAAQNADGIMDRIYRTLQAYANPYNYERPRIGGVAAGCPRGPEPTPERLAINARMMLNEWERVLGRPENVIPVTPENGEPRA